MERLEKVTLKEFLKLSQFVIVGRCPDRMAYVISETDEIRLFEKVKIKKINGLDFTCYIVKSVPSSNEDYTFLLTETQFEESIPVCVESFFGEFFLTPREVWDCHQDLMDDLISTI